MLPKLVGFVKRLRKLTR